VEDVVEAEPEDAAPQEPEPAPADAEPTEPPEVDAEEGALLSEEPADSTDVLPASATFGLEPYSLDSDLWSVRGATATGTAHLKKDTVGQDRFAVAAAEGLLVVAVADGAGSAIHGEVGAAVAVQAAVRTTFGAIVAHVDAGEATDIGWGTLLRTTVAACRSSVLALQRVFGGARHDWACTLAIAVVVPPYVWVAKVGDAFVVRWSGETDPVLLAEPVSDPTGRESDEVRYVNESVFLTSTTAFDELTIERDLFAPGDRLLLSTDGLAPVALARWNPPEAHQPFFRELARVFDGGGFDGSGLTDFLESTAINERTDDDKTAVLVQFVGEAELPDAEQ
jgi:serine/threonine protein phosphatase PrpC